MEAQQTWRDAELHDRANSIAKLQSEIERMSAAAASASSQSTIPPDASKIVESAYLFAQYLGYPRIDELIAGFSVLHHACERISPPFNYDGMLEVIEGLIEVLPPSAISQKVSQCRLFHYSPIHLLVANKGTEQRDKALQALIDGRADIEAKLDKHDQTALHRACSTGNESGVKILLQARANPRALSNGHSCFDLAKKSNSAICQIFDDLRVKKREECGGAGRCFCNLAKHLIFTSYYICFHACCMHFEYVSMYVAL